jgi:hypothetical protein
MNCVLSDTAMLWVIFYELDNLGKDLKSKAGLSETI